jgi:hypothetical protein
MHQVMMPLPIYLFLRARIAGVNERANKIFAAIALGFALIAAGGRVYIYETHAKDCKTCREYWPMRSYARAFQRAGFVRGTILAETYDLGGNLRAVFPDSRQAILCRCSGRRFPVHACWSGKATASRPRT